MKKYILTTICIIFTLMAFAQQNNPRRRFSPEEFKNRMEAFITKEACLTQDEAQKFFPMLHEMLEKQRETNGKSFGIMRKGFTAKSESDYQNIIEEVTDLEIENKKIEKNYYKKFHSVLSWEKIHKVRIAINKYNMEALRRFTPHRGPRK